MSELTVALKVTDFEFDHAVINELLDLKPTAHFMKGEEFYVGPANNRLKKIYETNYWEYRVHIKENAVWVTTIIKQFVKEYIESKVEALDTIKNKCGLELYVGLLYSKDDRLESFHLDIDLVKLFSRLNIEIDIDQHSNK